MSGLRIAVVSSGDPDARSGSARALAQLIGGLRDLGHDVLRIMGDDSVPAGPGAAAVMAAKLQRQVADCDRAFRSWRPQTVHIEIGAGFGHAALQAARALGLPVTSYWHRLHVAGPEADRERVLGLLLDFHRRVDRTFVNAEEDARMLREAGVPGVVLASRGVDTRLFAPDARSPELRRAWGAAQDDCVLLHVGRLIALKNLDLVADAAEAARIATPRTRLVVVGDGPECEPLRRRLPWATFTGALGDDTLAEVYASADAFLFPSLVDTFGNVVLEAMASGVAVVGFAVGVTARHVRDRVDGRSVDPTDRDAFIAAVTELAQDPQAARALGAAARAQALPLTFAAAVGPVAEELRALARPR